MSIIVQRSVSKERTWWPNRSSYQSKSTLWSPKIKDSNRIIDTTHCNIALTLIYFKCNGIHLVSIIQLFNKQSNQFQTCTGASFWNDHSFTGSLQPHVKTKDPYYIKKILDLYRWFAQPAVGDTRWVSCYIH